VPTPHMGTISVPLSRDVRNRTKRATGGVGARHATTRYAVREDFNGIASLVRCRLGTGRTHQIRVHLAHLGHPLVGDATYGAGFRSKIERLPASLKPTVRAFRRQALHAYLLCFAHPRTSEIMRFEANWPQDMAELVGTLRKLCR